MTCGTILGRIALLRSLQQVDAELRIVKGCRSGRSQWIGCGRSHCRRAHPVQPVALVGNRAAVLEFRLAASVFVSSKRFRTIRLDQYEIRILIPLADFNAWIEAQVSSRRETLVESAEPAQPSARLHSGAPGRPSSMHLVIAEAKRRIAAEKLPDSKTQFGKELSEWLKAERPDYPPVTQKTVTNNREITSLFRKAQTEGAI